MGADAIGFNLLLFLGIGRFLVWFIQTNGWSILIRERYEGKMIAKLLTCDFCAGCWVFPVLAYIFKINFLTPFYMPWVVEIITGWIAAFLVHLIRLGWNFQYGVLELE